MSTGRVPITFYVDQPLSESITKLATRLGMNRSQFLRWILRWYVPKKLKEVEEREPC